MEFNELEIKRMTNQFKYPVKVVKESKEGGGYYLELCEEVLMTFGPDEEEVALKMAHHIHTAFEFGYGNGLCLATAYPMIGKKEILSRGYRLPGETH